MTVLELDGIAARVETYRFDLLDATNEVVEENIAVEADTPASITNDVNRNLKRTLDGVHLSPAILSDIDMETERLRVVATIDGTEYPLGVFLFADDEDTVYTWGSESAPTFTDQGAILDDDIPTSVGYAAGASVQAALLEQAEAAGIVDVQIDATGATVSTPIAWPVGQTKRFKVMEDLCSLAGFYSPYFANAGTLRCKAVPDLTMVTAELTYGIGSANSGRVFDGSIRRKNNRLSTPNRYLVVASDGGEQSISGYFDVPADAPYSAENRGRTITAVYQEQGIADQTAAVAAAKAHYTADSSTYQWVSFDAAADPRHDTFDIVSFDGDLYREQGWKLTLAAGGAHHHDLRRVY